MFRLRRPLAVLSAVALTVTISVILSSRIAFADDYPSWEEVQAAKADVASRDAEASRLSGLISDLQTKVATLDDAAVNAMGVAAKADSAHRAATSKAVALAEAAAQAAQKAQEAHQNFGRAAARMAIESNEDAAVRLLFEPSSEAIRTLNAWSQLQQLSDWYSAVAAQARTATAEAEALSKQAEVAETERAKLAQEAASAAAVAKEADETAQAELNAQQQTLNTLYAQLADLRNRTAELERRYEISEQARLSAEAAESTQATGNGSDWVPAPPPGVVADPAGAQGYARAQMSSFGWDDGEFRCLIRLWNQESGWRADAYNTESAAYGIPQALPGSKMATAGADWRTNAQTQINWGLSYIAGRYGSPCGAWEHEVGYNWY